MATLQVLIDDLNQRLGDVTNAADVGEPTKIRWLAHGVRAMWPKVYRTVVDTSLSIVANTYEYALPATFDDAEIFRVEVKVGPALERWARVDNYIIDRRTSKMLVFEQLPGIAGATLRIHAALPPTVPTAAASTLDFPDRFNELPVWYALGLAMQGGQQDRLNYKRYSTVAARNGVDVGELMSSAQFCFSQFELLLDRLAMPWPAG